MSAGAPLWRYIRLALAQRRPMALALLLGLATVGCGIGLLAVAGGLIARAALRPSIADLQLAISGVRAFGVTRAVWRYLERLVTHGVTLRLLARLRVWFYTAIVPLAPAGLEAHRSGDLLSRIVADIETLEQMYARLLAPPVVAVLVAGLLALWVGHYDARLAGVALACYGLAGVGVPALTHGLGRAAGARLIVVRAAWQEAWVDGLQGMAELLVCGRAAEHRERCARLAGEWVRLQARLTRLGGLHEALVTLAGGVAVLAVLAVAAPLAAQGRLDGVLLAGLALGVLAAFEAVAPLPAALQQLEPCRAAARRLNALADAPPPVPSPAGPSPDPGPAPALVFDDVTLRYTPEGAPALDGVRVAIPFGQRVAIVGPSGAGKSSFAHLLLRWRDPQAGAVRLGGHDLRTFQPDDLPAYVTVATQSAWLFGGTLRDNLLLACPAASAADCARVLALVRLDTFVAALPRGLETEVGEQGVQLSGGQRRRLALAQALLRPAPLLVLDEPTADLDAETESSLLETLWNLPGPRTVLLITHRLVGLDRANRVLVLQAGRLVEDGAHAALAARPGPYRTLLEQQAQAWARD